MLKLVAVFTVLTFATSILIATSRPGVTPSHIPEGSHTALVPPWLVFNVAVKLNSFFVFLARVTTPPDVAALDLATAWWKSEVTYGLAYNGIFSMVASSDSGVTCGDVATSLDLQEFVVCQYMQGGVELHLMERNDSSDTYTLTSTGSMFLEDKLHSFLLMINEETRNGWRGVSTKVIKSGKVSGFEAHYGQDFWTWHNEHPDKGAQFDNAMMSLSPGPTGAMISDWKPPREDIVLCDIGGGVGAVLADVLEHYPRMRGMVLDQPAAADRANEYLKEKGLSDRAEAVGGSFFEPFPAKFSECDVYHLRFIIHDWPDAENILILKNIKESAESAPTKTKKSVAIMGFITSTGASASMEQAKRLMSINMVSGCPYGSRERNISEHEELFVAAGYSGARDIKVTPLRTIQTLIEAEI